MLYWLRMAARQRCWWLGLPLALVACDGSILGGPSDEEDLASRAQFSQIISIAELAALLAEGTTRVEIKLRNGELVARELEVETSDETSDEEQVESSVTDVQAADGHGLLVLALGDLQIDFDQTTRFRGGDNGDMTLEEFVAEIRTRLDAGKQPAIEAKRSPLADPQAPDDATFLASELELEGNDDDAQIEINVDADNLLTNDDPPPDGWIQVLGLTIELRVADGTTELEVEDDDVDGDQKIAALVEAVDIANRAVTIAGGALVRLVEGTRVEFDDGLSTLQAVADAVAADRAVEIEGEVVVEFTAPLTFIAIEVEFELAGSDDGDDD